MKRDVSKEILQVCDKLHNIIVRNQFYLNHFISEGSVEYNRAFTSIDAIEDSENAIQHALKLANSSSSNRPTLFIYGILQAIYIQQDCIAHLTKIINRDVRKTSKILESIPSFKAIRQIRNDIAGHPISSGKNSSFIAKGPNDGLKFKFATISPEGYSIMDVNLSHEVDLHSKEVITIMKEHLTKLKEDLKAKSEEIIESLVELNLDSDLRVNYTYRFIKNKHPLGESEPERLLRSLEFIESNLRIIYPKEEPESVITELLNAKHTLNILIEMSKKNELHGSKDAEILCDALSMYFKSISESYKEILICL